MPPSSRPGIDDRQVRRKIANRRHDGLPDGDDACPGTPVGTTVAADGRPAPSSDADGDGVPDDRDLCPGTSSGASVDADGCAIQNPDDSGDDTPEDPDDPADPAGHETPPNGDDRPLLGFCGAGLAETLAGLLLCLTLVPLRRRR